MKAASVAFFLAISLAIPKLNDSIYTRVRHRCPYPLWEACRKNKPIPITYMTKGYNFLQSIANNHSV